MSDQRIEEIEDRTGSPTKSLHGALADTGNPDVGACPDEISETVARYYALTECGRLFHWRRDRLKEMTIWGGSEGRYYFQIKVGGKRWKVERSTLRDRLFPGRRIDSKIDWDQFEKDYFKALRDGVDADIPGLGADPLRDKGVPNDGKVKKRTADRDEYKRARRKWYAP